MQICWIFLLHTYTFFFPLSFNSLCVLNIALIKQLEKVAIANALQLEAARRPAVPIRFNFVACGEFELAQPTRCPLTAFLLLIRYVTLLP